MKTTVLFPNVSTTIRVSLSSELQEKLYYCNIYRPIWFISIHMWIIILFSKRSKRNWRTYSRYPLTKSWCLATSWDKKPWMLRSTMTKESRIDCHLSWLGNSRYARTVKLSPRFLWWSLRKWLFISLQALEGKCFQIVNSVWTENCSIREYHVEMRMPTLIKKHVRLRV